LAEGRSGSLKWLKGLVIGMGVLIALLATVMIGELVRRAFLTGDAGDAARPATAVDLNIPADSRFVGLTSTRSHIALHAVLPDGRHRVYIVDPAAGRVTGVIDPDIERGGPAAPDGGLSE
jgi:hypothetical protein